MNLLTPRQLEFLVHAANGKLPQEIAKECFVSPRTVHNTIDAARVRLGTKTTGQAIVRAIAYELIVIDHEGTASERVSDREIISALTS